MEAHPGLTTGARHEDALVYKDELTEAELDEVYAWLHGDPVEGDMAGWLEDKPHQVWGRIIRQLTRREVSRG